MLRAAFQRAGELAKSVAPLQRNLYQFLSREIAREQNIMLLLGSMRAEQRLAAFLLNLSQRSRPGLLAKRIRAAHVA